MHTSSKKWPKHISLSSWIDKCSGFCVQCPNCWALPWSNKQTSVVPSWSLNHKWPASTSFASTNSSSPKSLANATPQPTCSQNTKETCASWPTNRRMNSNNKSSIFLRMSAISVTTSDTSASKSVQMLKFWSCWSRPLKTPNARSTTTSSKWWNGKKPSLLNGKNRTAKLI